MAAGSRPRRTGPPPVAVIDIGSNSGRVMVYRLEGGGHLHALAGSRAPLRLARRLDRTGRIAPEALERAFAALADFRSIARGWGVWRLIAVGTSALRDAANGPAFIRQVRRRLGIRIRILSGEEEAGYGFLGAAGALAAEDGVLFDLGGGSLQLVRFRARRLQEASSLPLGALRVSDAFLRSDPPSPREQRRLRAHVRAMLARAGVERLGHGGRLLGTGGTLRNLARVDQRAAPYPVPRLHGYVLTRRRLRKVVARLGRVRLKKRGRIAGLNADRRDSILGGALVIETLMEALAADEVVVSGQGVREGVARSLMRGAPDSSRAAREGSLRALAGRFAGWSERRAKRRRALAAALYAALERPPRAELAEMLGHAAGILDVGRSIDFFDRHSHAADLVLATDLAGFSHRQLALLSVIVRQAGDEDERPRSLAPLLDGSDRPAIARAAAILELADEISERCRPGSSARASCRVGRGRVVVEVPALESWGARRLGERFRKAFGRALRVVPGGSYARRAGRSRE